MLRTRFFTATALAAARFVSSARPAKLSAHVNRHIGPTEADTKVMLDTLGLKSLDEMMSKIVPKNILRPPMAEEPAMPEDEALGYLRSVMQQNKINIKSLIGQGYYESILPATILRNVLENPAWYTPYTPYQSEIAQGRAEGLLVYQTVITELTKMDIANASLLDHASAAGEAMYMCMQHHRSKRMKILVAEECFKYVSEGIKTRAKPFGLEVVMAPTAQVESTLDASFCGVVVQGPDANGQLHDFTSLFAKAKKVGALGCCSTDLMACTMTKPPGEMGADVVFGNTQRFGMPLGFGGPAAAFFGTRADLMRLMPGRVLGISRDAQGGRCIRMAIQTREQHIKREKATSNVCTAQALMANMVHFYAVYHGPAGLKQISNEIHAKAKTIAVGLESAGHTIVNPTFFDTLTVRLGNGLQPAEYSRRCVEKGLNIFVDPEGRTVSISVDEATKDAHLVALLEAAGLTAPVLETLGKLAASRQPIPAASARTSEFMTESVFNTHHNESDMMRYIWTLQRRDYGLQHGMIPLGSCTMKLNPAASMLPLSWPEVGRVHPFVPEDQARGYLTMAMELEQKLKSISGFAAVSLQPNSGAQGEYSGLRVIRAYHESRGESHRNVCMIPQSAHGTNPASACLNNFNIVTIKCTKQGKIDLADLRAQVTKHGKNLGAIMITYPSTYGVFDTDVKEITELVHAAGGQVYIDGANFNAMVGHTAPAWLGGDVCHVNLHKTFALPHGGGGPGLGPICVAEHLAPFLPTSVYGAKVGGSNAFGITAASGYSSASILTIAYMHMLMCGSSGLKSITEYAILAANYLRARLEKHYPILFHGDTGFCAHEFIADMRGFKATAGVESEDIAKRLMDYGLHAPTLSFPVPGTLMVEPTESEPLAELDRMADALISIRQEIRDIEEGRMPRNDNPLKNAPHTMKVVTAAEWKHPYTREVAAFPSEFTKKDKFWPYVGRIDGPYGDRNLACSCDK